MQKVFGLLFIVLAVWAGAELFMKGPAGAFDGAFASFLTEEEQQAEHTWAGERAGNKLRAKHDERADAINRMTRE